MKKPLVLVGAGGFGREVLWYVTQVNDSTHEYDILGFVDDNPEMKGQVVHDLPVLGGLDWLLSRNEPTCVLVCIGSPHIRRTIVQVLLGNSSLEFPVFIAENAQLGPNVKVGRGGIICRSSILTVDITIGDFALINLGCKIGHDSTLGDFVTIFSSTSLSGNVHVGDEVEFGTDVIVIPGVTVGEGTIVGAGAVVVKDLPAHCTAVGSPAKPIKFHDQ